MWQFRYTATLLHLYIVLLTFTRTDQFIGYVGHLNQFFIQFVFRKSKPAGEVLYFFLKPDCPLFNCLSFFFATLLE